MSSSDKVNLRALPTSLLLSIVALPVSVIAFALAYSSDDPFLSVLWMGAILPTIWVAVIVLAIRGRWKERPWRSIAAGPLLLAPTVVLFGLMLSPRFAFHQLFTFRPLDLHLPTNNLVYFEKVAVCAPEATCTSRNTLTRTFRMTKVPDGYCSLFLINGQGGKHKVQTVHIVLNGGEVNFPAGAVQVASVKLDTQNELTIQVTGSADAYVYVMIWRGRESRS